MNGNAKTQLWAVALVLVGAASYGMGTVVFKLASADGAEAVKLTFQQVLSGAAMLWLVWAAIRLSGRGKSSLRSLRGSVLLVAAIGIVGLSLTTVLFNQSLARLDASLAIVLLFQFAWITIFMESLRRRAWPSRFEAAAVAFVVAGTVLAVGLLEQDLQRLDALGVLLGLLAALTYSLFFFLSGFVKASVDPVARSAAMSTASLLFVTALSGQATLDWSGPHVGWGLLLGLLGTALPFYCFNYGIPRVGGGLAALLGAMELPATVVAAYALLNEPLSVWQGCGIALIIAGIVTAQRKPRQTGPAGKEGENRH